MKNNRSEIRRLFANLKQNTTTSEIRELHARSIAKSLLAFVKDWSAIAISIALACKSVFLVPFALLIIGSRQRALSNLVHDASHGNLSNSKSLNDKLANILAAYPMFDTVQAYRSEHMKHHRFLADQNLDPDSKAHLRYGYDDRATGQSSPKAFAKILFNLSSWSDSLLGGFFNLQRYEKTKIVAWWLMASGALYIGLGSKITLLSLTLWMVSRGTAYHLIRLCAEFLDHTGLPTTTTITFSRNLPHGSFLAKIFHPHEDTYHLIHHIFMGIPHFQLKKAHVLLSKSSIYRSAHHCDSYVLGSHSAVSCWLGKCAGGGG